MAIRSLRSVVWTTFLGFTSCSGVLGVCKNGTAFIVAVSTELNGLRGARWFDRSSKDPPLLVFGTFLGPSRLNLREGGFIEAPFL